MTPSTPSYIALERVAITCALGLRFVDRVTGSPVTDGLLVEAYPPGDDRDDRPRVRGIANRSGIFSFPRLPGLTEFENGLDDRQRWQEPLDRLPFIVTVRDLDGRFLPCRFRVEAPQRAAFDDAESPSPPSPILQSIDLFSANARPIPGGYAVIRAEFVSFSDRLPLPWTLLEVHIPHPRRPRSFQGLADAAGRAVVILPYPEAIPALLGSPLAIVGFSVPPWEVRFRAWHDPTQNGQDWADLDRLRERAKLSPALLFDGESPPVPFERAELRLGRELIVPERLPPDERPRQLLLTPAV